MIFFQLIIIQDKNSIKISENIVKIIIRCYYFKQNIKDLIYFLC